MIEWYWFVIGCIASGAVCGMVCARIFYTLGGAAMNRWHARHSDRSRYC